MLGGECNELWQEVLARQRAIIDNSVNCRIARLGFCYSRMSVV